MTLLPPLKLLDEDKLEILQRLDRHRQWHSLDEKRYCIVCGKIITGREVQVVAGPHGTAELRAVCPTKNCCSIPMDWSLPTDEILAKMSMLRAEQLHHRDYAGAELARPSKHG